MLCEAMCDAGGPNQLSETIGNLGLWTRLGILTTGTSLETHQTVRFFVWVSLLFDFWIGRNTHAGRLVFILTNGCKSNPNPPQHPKTQKKQ